MCIGLIGGRHLNELPPLDQKIVERRLDEIKDQMAQCGEVHQDMRPENVIYDNTGKVCIIEFGRCTFAEEINPETTDMVSNPETADPLSNLVSTLKNGFCNLTPHLKTTQRRQC